MSTEELAPSSARVDLCWMRLGAGDNTHCVRGIGRIFGWVTARYRHREPLDLYHSALEVRTGDGQFVIEMSPGVGHRRAGPRRRGRGTRGVDVAWPLPDLPKVTDENANHGDSDLAAGLAGLWLFGTAGH